VIHSFARNIAELDYGPCIIVRHALRVTLVSGDTNHVVFFTLYGHLSASSLVDLDGKPRLQPGQRVSPAEPLAWVGGERVNGGWPPHLHFQLLTDASAGDPGWIGDYPGVCTPAGWAGAYHALCPDPNVLLRCPFVAPLRWAPLRTAAEAGVAAVEVL
jgi:murein DD-endopeptidase MepM/ murein hydrolase activator NlpD